MANGSINGKLDPSHFLKNKGHPSLTIRQDSVMRLYYIYEEVNGT